MTGTAFALPPIDPALRAALVGRLRFDGNRPPVLDRCMVSVPVPWRKQSHITRQCGAQRGRGLDGLYCATHRKTFATVHHPRVAEALGILP